MEVEVIGHRIKQEAWSLQMEMEVIGHHISEQTIGILL
jgi:hypothetical protein